ncbi:MAG TPA: ABC transporter permease [Blastocatellia bacterium]|nr:ABC transporter permease [Blastocatellia bacterium]
MASLRVFLHRLRGLFRKGKLDRELHDEINSHVQMQIEENQSMGMPDDEARRAALRKFGGVDQVKETYRNRRSLPLIETIMQDAGYGLRRMIKSPGFTVVAILTLALGIGANVAMFSVINSILLRPLPYKDPDRVMIMWNQYGERGQRLPRVSIPDFFDYEQDARTFDQFAAAIESTAVLTGNTEPEHVERAHVTAKFFSALGVSMFLGREFTPEETADNGPNVAIMTYRLWKRRFGADPSLIGKTIQINTVSFTIVGILPEDFRWYPPPEVRIADADIWDPLRITPTEGSRTNNIMTVIGRLKPGVTLAQAQSDMDGVADRLRTEHIEHKNSGIIIKPVPLQEDLVKRIRPTLLVLFAAVCFILLIACANLANLMLIRSVGREREIAIRLAIGANRARVIRQMLTESGLLSLSGGIIGLVLAYWGLKLLVLMQPAGMPRLESVAIDYRVLVFSLGLCLMTPILFGLAPALHSTKTNLSEVLRSVRVSSTSGIRKLRGLLVIVEIALSLTLLIGAGLLIRTFISMQNIHTGYDPENVLTFRLYLPPLKYTFGSDTTNTNPQFSRDLEARIADIPGVESVGAAAQLPLTAGGFQTGYAWDDDSEQRLSSYSADWRYVSPGYFKTMHARLLEGRFFDEHDDANSQPVMIVDDLMAKKIWPGQSAIGKRMKDEGRDRRWKVVVGVVEHMLNDSLTSHIQEQIYVAQRQMGNTTISFAVRTNRDFGAVMTDINNAIHTLDPQLAAFNVRPMSEYVADAMAQTRYSLILIGALGIAALLLAAIGLYGVISYSVSQRTNEIGIRVALGGRQTDILKLILSEGMVLTAIGVIAGLACALPLAYLMQQMTGVLFGVSAIDPLTYGAISLLLVSVSLLATYVPARRASRIDPMTALRYE